MKILFYRNKLNRGGMGRVMTNLANMFACSHESIFVTLRKHPDEYSLNKNVKRYNMTTREKASRMIADIYLFFQMAGKLRKILKQEKPDVIITFYQLDSLFVFLSKIFLRFPQIVSVRNDPYIELRKKHKRILYKLLYSLTDGCVFQTEHAKAFFSQKIQRKSAVIHNLIEKRLFDIIMDERKDIIGIGRLDSGKSWHVAIKAFSLIADQVIAKLFIYGGGEKHDYLSDYIEKLNLSDRVILAGYTTKVEEIVANAKLFVFASEHEGMPNAIIEALILGTPCISTRFSGGSADMLIESGINGVLVPVGDYEAMATAMLKILTDFDYAKQLGQNAKERARTEFDPEKVFGQWENFIISIIGKRKK